MILTLLCIMTTGRATAFACYDPVWTRLSGDLFTLRFRLERGWFWSNYRYFRYSGVTIPRSREARRYHSSSELSDLLILDQSSKNVKIQGRE